MQPMQPALKAIVAANVVPSPKLHAHPFFALSLASVLRVSHHAFTLSWRGDI